MALSPNASSSQPTTVSPEPETPNPKKKKVDTEADEIHNESKALVVYESLAIVPYSAQSCSSPPPPRKRNKSPGVRVVGGRIYDSENGKTCHQCRQKTRDFVVLCKSHREDKPCILKYCHKCLINRYGEKAEVASQVEDWKCPKCRGICNCSHCMKKRGHPPTGSLLYTAKANGFRTVLEMMTVNGPEMITASLNRASICNGEYNPSSPLKAIMPAHPLKMEEDAQIKMEYSDPDYDMFEGGRDDDTQSSERTKEDNFGGEVSHNAIKNEGNMQTQRDNSGQEVRISRKMKWKQLARAKSSSAVQEGSMEDGAQSQMTPLATSL